MIRALLFSIQLILQMILSTAAAAQALTGIAHSIDGDSLTFGEQGVRLFGIDAPEYQQTCEVNFSAWACGADAAAALRSAIDGRLVTCSARDRDVYGRSVSRCLVDGRDAAATMVRQGLAIVLENGRTDYAMLEEQAKRNQLGIWGSKSITPAEYRSAQGKWKMTNVRQLGLPQWRRPAERPENRCLVPLTEFCEFTPDKHDLGDGKPPLKGEMWFQVVDQPVFAVAGFWQRTTEGNGFTMVTCEPNSLVEPIHPKAMITILAPDDTDTWLRGSYDEIVGLQRPYDPTMMTVRGPVFPTRRDER